MNRALSFICLLISFSSFSQYKSETFKEASASGSATMHIHYFDVTYFSEEKNGAPTGINIDIVQDFVAFVKEKKKISLTTKYYGSPEFKKLYDNVKGAEGLVMGMGAIASTEERKREIGLTKPYITFYNVLVSHNQVPTLTKMEDIGNSFKGLTAYTMKGSMMEKALNQVKQKYFNSMEVKIFPSVKEYTSKTIMDNNSFAYFMLPHYIEAVRTSKPIKRHPIADTELLAISFIFPKNSGWVEVFDEFLNADGGYTNSKRYKAILTKHMGETGVKLLKMK